MGRVQVTLYVDTELTYGRARLPSLYSDFRGQRTINSDGYTANIAAWESGLAAAAKAGVLPDGVFAVQFGTQLEHELQTRENGLPQALGAVEEEAVIHGHMIPLSHFLASPKSIYDRSWDLSLSQVPLKLASWVLQQAGLVSKATKDPAHKYVLVSNLEDAGTALVNVLLAQTRRVDRAVPIDEFRKLLTEVLKVDRLSEIDLQVLLTFLHRDKRVIAYNHKAVKIKSTAESEPLLTPEDENICSLKSLILELNAQAMKITERVEKFAAKAREAVAKKNKTLALAALRSRKVQEDLLTKRSATLAQLEGVFAKIEEAADQVEVVKVMEGSTQVLRSLSKETGGIEKVEDVLASLQDEVAKVDEVGTMIGEQSTLAAGIDETAVDDELEQMEAEARAEQERREAEATSRRLAELNIEQTPADPVSEPTPARTEEKQPIADPS